MILTKLGIMNKSEALPVCQRMWKRLEETGGDDKAEVLKELGYENLLDDCPLCEACKSYCDKCLYYEKFGHCCEGDSYFNLWRDARTTKNRRKYASLFLEQVNQLEVKE